MMSGCMGFFLFLVLNYFQRWGFFFNASLGLRCCKQIPRRTVFWIQFVQVNEVTLKQTCVLVFGAALISLD